MELPPAHLSVRIPWHDTDWTGRVCAAPAANHACTVLKNIKQKKDADDEEARRGAPWPDAGAESTYPPCVMERAGFMRPGAHAVSRSHAYAKRQNAASHGHFQDTVHRMPAYSIEAVPYRWTRREAAPDIARRWGIAYDQSLEDAADRLMGWSSDWVQDHRNQRALLDSFFSAIRPRESIILIYAKDIPLLEDRAPGARILVGAGRIEEVGPIQEWPYNCDQVAAPLRSYLWERAVHHSIRPGFRDGFLLPYQQILREPHLAGEDLSPFAARTPTDHFDEFSYVSELVSHDGAIAALTELHRVLGLLPGQVEGPWDAAARWVDERIAETWNQRGPFPGLGAVLVAAGIERGLSLAYRINRLLPNEDPDPWPLLDRAIGSADGPLAPLVGRMGRLVWERMAEDADRVALVRLLARFPLTIAQARRMLDRKARSEAGISATDTDMVKNPYVLFEADRGRFDSISMAAIDRGLFSQDATARLVLEHYPLPEPITEAGDDRRVRAGCTQILETAAAEGHTLLDEPRLRRRLARLPLNPICDPESEVFDLSAARFAPILVETPLARDQGRGWQLARLAEYGDLIAAEVARRIERGPLDVRWDWRDLIDAALSTEERRADAVEDPARYEKARALEALARAPIGVLVGPAGTGKTTMLQALCRHPDVRARGVLLLAPTGKARVQLASRIGARSQTLAQFLRPTGRWHDELGYRTRPGAPKNGGYGTVVVDEASMLTEDMLASLIDALQDPDRLILCGDHRQLPPIGAGRPFADLVQHLRGQRPDAVESYGAGLAELTISLRQASGGGDRTRDDIAVASLFTVEDAAPGADEALARVLAGEGDGTLEIQSWRSEDELHQLIVRHLADRVGITLGESTALRTSLGATGSHKGRPSFIFGSGGRGAENWQILSPELLYTALTRQREGVVLFVQGDPAAIRELGSPERSDRGRRLTRLFRPADPFETPDGRLFDGSHVHRTSNRELVCSKSEVIVADTLLRLGVPYAYESDLVMPDGTRRRPDFTIRRRDGRIVYWEHLGMLGLAGYKADWEAKKVWYAQHGIRPWTEGGGPAGILVWSQDDPVTGGIDVPEIERRASKVCLDG
ncbi:MAG TPA: AAA family ATPase [Longimicrobium sp.]|uniref:AAA family ATPase n=1 Tax=Longimicrobium sp. TaxID=2029185 RepID=UPI002ED9D342